MNYFMLNHIAILVKALLIFFHTSILKLSLSQKPFLVIQKFYYSTVFWLNKIHINIAFTIP